MALTMKEKQAVTKQLALEYKRARKKEKGKILDMVIELTGYNRSYAARVLRQRARPKVLGRGKLRGVTITLVEDERTRRKKLLEISSATIDRLLSPVKKRYQLRARSNTKPGTLLKNRTPIRTFSEWGEKRPGFVEIDLVGHEGGDPSGDFAQTLDTTDVCTGWTETRAVKNKAQVWVFEGLMVIRERIPFAILGIDSDNGCRSRCVRGRADPI